MEKYRGIQVHESQRNLTRQDQKQSLPQHIIVQLSKVKQMILKYVHEK